ncbi:FAD-dependent oxidoreductase [Klebsiella pneumoniae subsp. pneumoniae]|nr:FAD-dependent oxidoreductase [Klebsiella pneumoniae subsp. pneumoniae]
MVHFCDQKHHVVVIGAGFGGLSVVRELEEPGVSITIIDRSNHHLFPSLYFIRSLAHHCHPQEIAWPVRSLFRHREDVRTLMAEVQDVDTDSREVLLKDGSRIDYDTLVVATGATHAYFGHDEWEQFAPGLKNLDDATTLRARILFRF